MIDAALEAGACACAMTYLPGQCVSELTYEDALWSENNLPAIVAGLDLPAPLFTLASVGYGHGDGYGDGYGYGFGHGYGDIYTRLFEETR